MLSTSHPAANVLWSNLLEATARRQSFFTKILPAVDLTLEERATRAREAAEYRAQRDADEARIPAFLSALEALCREHGVSIKAEVGDFYEGDDFRAYLGLARIESLNTTPPSPEEAKC